MLQTYAQAGYRTTVIATLYKAPEGLELRPEIMKWTHDVHVLPAFLRARDFPRYIKHIIRSRGVREVIMSNSQLVYEMLPALTAELPYVKFIDVSSMLAAGQARLIILDLFFRSTCTTRLTTDGSQADTPDTPSSISATWLGPSPVRRI